METGFLPIEFVERIRHQLLEEADAFLATYDEPRVFSLRVNPLKPGYDTVNLEQVKWCETGYYYDEKDRPGSSVEHHAGMIYIQEASAMAPVELLNPRPGEKVLDLCAAPGGKSTQIAGKLMGEGLLVSNEPVSNRAAILSENLERLGVKNAIVVSEDPSRLKDRLEEFFDAILVDAPCSGEGMFRKDNAVISEWSVDNVKLCAARQRDILESAAAMLKSGGRMVYSTCTFAPAEDEENMKWFVTEHPEFTLVKDEHLWPHQLKGEGHYMALLQKAGATYDDGEISKKPGKISEKELTDFYDFWKKTINLEIPGNLYKQEDLLYAQPDNAPELKGIHILRSGVFLGTFKKGRFEPGHGLAMSLKSKETKNVVHLSEEDANKYICGETIASDTADGWCLVCYKNNSLGWGKASKGIVKNHYPKGLRKM